MKSIRLNPLLALLVLAAAVFAGCGDSDDATEQTTTKAAFIRQADQICRKADKAQELKVGELGKKVRRTGKAMNDEELILAAGLPPLRQEVEELQELPLPEDSAQAEAIIAEIEKAIEATEEDPKSLVSEETPFAEAEAKARAYGLKVCGVA